MENKPLVWLGGDIKTPPFSSEARIEAGYLLRQLQQGEKLSMPQSRPMPVIGANCHELRIKDADQEWRVMYHIAEECIVVLDVFAKKTRETPPQVIETCQARLQRFIKKLEE